MFWLSVEAWLERCGVFTAGLRAEYRARGGEDELLDALARDPRRLVALVGAAGAGTSRMALELARRTSWARYPDPHFAPDVDGAIAQLEQSLAGLDAAAAPLIVLDGPDRDESLALLAALVSRPLHPRLHVLVPCDPATARRLRRLAGGYPGGSILVATIAGEPAPPEALPPSLPAELVTPFALLGRCRSGAFPGQRELVAAGMLAVAGDEVVCLLGDRVRAAVVDEQLVRGAGGDARLRDILDAEPGRRTAAVTALLRWTGRQPPLHLLAALLAFDTDSFPDPLDFWQLGIPLAPQVMEMLLARGRHLLDVEIVNAGAADRLRECVTTFEVLAGADSEPPTIEEAAAAVADTRARGDYQPRARALRQYATLLEQVPDLSAASTCYEEWLALETKLGTAVSRAQVCMAAGGVASKLNDHATALARYGEALEHRRNIADPVGQLFALYRIAGGHYALDDIAACQRVLHTALELAAAIGDATGSGYCHWLLGSVVDKLGDAERADRHYSAAIDAYAQTGTVPPRLLARQRTASIAAAGMRQQAALAGGAPLPAVDHALPMPPEPEPSSDLVQLRLRRGDER